jgi:hypothetical protein
VTGGCDAFCKMAVLVQNVTLSLMKVSDRGTQNFSFSRPENRSTGRPIEQKYGASLASPFCGKPPTTKTSRSVNIAHNHGKSALSKGQRTCNSLVKQIEKRCQRLRTLEAALKRSNVGGRIGVRVEQIRREHARTRIRR